MVTTRSQDRAEKSSPASVNKRKRFSSPGSDISNAETSALESEGATGQEPLIAAATERTEQTEEDVSDVDDAPEVINSKTAAHLARRLPNRSLKHAANKRRKVHEVSEALELPAVQSVANAPLTDILDAEESRSDEPVTRPSDETLSSTEPSSTDHAATEEIAAKIDTATPKEETGKTEVSNSTSTSTVDNVNQEVQPPPPPKLARGMPEEDDVGAAPTTEPAFEATATPSLSEADEPVTATFRLKNSDIVIDSSKQEEQLGASGQESRLEVERDQVSTFTPTTRHANLEILPAMSASVDSSDTYPTTTEVIIDRHSFPLTPTAAGPIFEAEALPISEAEPITAIEEDHQGDANVPPPHSENPLPHTPTEAQEPVIETPAQEQRLPETPKSVTSGMITPVWTTRRPESPSLAANASSPAEKVTNAIKLNHPRSSVTQRHTDLLLPKSRRTSLQQYRDRLLSRHQRTTTWGPPGYRKTKFVSS